MEMEFSILILVSQNSNHDVVYVDNNDVESNDSQVNLKGVDDNDDG